LRKAFKTDNDLLQEIANKLEELVKGLPLKGSKEEDEILDNSDFIRRLKISPRLAQSWRDKGLIAYSQIGNKIYYRRADIDQLLKEHFNKSLNNYNN
jgi:hypothetical protein